MNILIYGIGGSMGKFVYDCLKEEKTAFACCGVDKFCEQNLYNIPVFSNCDEINVDVDCIIDFSVHEAVLDYIPYAVKNKIPCVIATTGHNSEEKTLINMAAKAIPIFQSGNMAIGINVLLQLIKKATAVLGDKADIEIIEMHHNKKIDAPSGTALMLAQAVKQELPSSKFVYGREGIVGKREKNEIGIHAIRGGTVVGKHSIMFLLNNEIITLTHECENKAMFARGSINAALFISDKQPGFYNMDDMLNS